MATVIGAASGVLALTIFAFKASKSLYEAVSSFKSKPKDIRDIQTDLGTLVTVLDSICQQAQGSGNKSKLELLRKPIECCTKTCQEMQEMFNACSIHTKDSRNSVRDWLNMRYHEKSFDDFKRQLASYKSTLSITFASINVQDNTTTQDLLDELKDSIEATKEDLEVQLSRIEQAISCAKLFPRDLLADQAHLKSCLDSLAEAQRVAENTKAQVVIERNRVGEDGRGLFGADTFQPGFSLTVSDNEAQRGAVMAAGVHSPGVLQTLLIGSPAADIMHVVQALQTQPPNINIDMLQSFLTGRSTGHVQRAVDSPPTMNLSPGDSAHDEMSRDAEMLPCRNI